MAYEELQAAISMKVPLEAWEVWKRLPRERKAFLKSVFLALLVGASNMEVVCNGVQEVVLKADKEVLEVMKKALGGSDDCKEAVRKLYEKLMKGEIHWSEYEAKRFLKVWLKPCFE